MTQFQNTTRRAVAQQNQNPMVGQNVITGNSRIRKLVGATNRFGNPGIKNQQLTSFEIFHYLPFSGTKGTYNFFENVNAASFPFANIQENRLQVGESMIIQRLHFTIATIDTSAPTDPIISDVQSFQEAGFDGLYLSQLNWLNDNNRVVKEISLTSMQPEFNPHAYNNVNNSLRMDTDISIQPLLRFVAQLRVSSTPGVVTNLFIGCHATGTGTLLAPKTTY